MKTKAKLLCFIMVMTMVFALCSCNVDSGAKYEIGICQLVEHSAHDEATKGFMDALNAVLGEENIDYNVQSAQNDISNCTAIVNQFVSNDVDLIVANATAVLQAAVSATDTIPILGTSITEYGVALELDSFDGIVGGNVSGTSDLAPLDAQAVMIKEWVPDAKTVALLYCSAEANSQYQVDVVKAEVEKLGMSAKYYPFADSMELAAVCQTAASECDVIYVPTDNTVASNSGIIDNICRPMKKVVIAGEEGIACGVAALSISYYDMGYTTGQMAAKILRGEADISKMPIEYTKAAKKYNEELCRELGLTAPDGYEPVN